MIGKEGMGATARARQLRFDAWDAFALRLKGVVGDENNLRCRVQI